MESPEEIIAPLRAELEQVKGEREKEREQDRATIADLKRAYNACWAGSPAVKAELDYLRAVLALASAKAEEARRAGVKCFDESHPDDLPARIHAIMEAHEKEHRHHIYRRSLLEKALFDELNLIHGKPSARQ